MRRSLLLAAVLYGLAGSAFAQDTAARCAAYGLGDDPAASDLRVVTGEGRVNVLAPSDEIKGCPAAGAQCAQRAFLVAGDRVLVSDVEGEFACADFVGKKGAETTGWLPVSRLADAPSKPGWVGKWKRDTSSTIDIVPGKGGRLAVNGEALWQGIGDNVHTGEIGADIDGSKTVASWAEAVDGETQKPYDQAGEFDCKIRKAQLGPYLVVDDSGNCGGARVNFTGIYVRR